MGRFLSAHNGLIDAHNQLEEEIKSILAQLADLEDSNRRNNIKLRGIPESISTPDMTPYIQLIKKILPAASNHRQRTDFPSQKAFQTHFQEMS